MKFVLIAMLFNAQTPLVIEFNSLVACEKAKQEIKFMTVDPDGKSPSLNRSNPFSACVPKK